MQVVSHAFITSVLLSVELLWSCVLIFLMADQRVSLLLQGYQEAVRSKKSTGVTCNPKSQVL